MAAVIDPKKELLKKRKKLIISPETALSTGSTMLNLAHTDHPRHGFVKGQYYELIGDSSSGKTWLSMTCFAEAQLNRHFQDYELHFFDVEEGALMDLEKFFGITVAEKIITHPCRTIQDYYRTLYDLLVVKKKKILYALDSQDALENAAAQKKFKEQKKAAESGEKEVGSYGDGKAKYHSENIRWVKSALRDTGSIGIVIMQTRDNPAAFGFQPKKVHSGGKSHKFYAAAEMWCSVGKPLMKLIRGKPRNVGSTCIVEVRKNRVTGKIGKGRSAVIPIYYSHGIDDTGSLVEFLIAEGGFEKVSDKPLLYKVPDTDFTGSKNQIIKFFEDSDSEELLQDMAAEVWNEIEAECELVNRKKRYE